MAERRTIRAPKHIGRRLFPFAAIVVFYGIHAASARCETTSSMTVSAPTAESPTSEPSVKPAPIDRVTRKGRWFVAETRSFFVCSDESAAHAEALARGAEKLRIDFAVRWLGRVPHAVWSPRCHIVLHGTRSGYAAAVGRGSEQTIGSSLVHVDKGRITGRRIDLIGGRTDYLTAALPHELTHIVLRDHFRFSIPAWADEGTAVLADLDEKQGRHHHDLRCAIAAQSTFRAAELLMLSGYPQPERVGTFYGQSASLVRFLVERRNPARFVEFLDHATTAGYDAALAAHYGIADAQELDRHWRSSLEGEQLVVGDAE